MKRKNPSLNKLDLDNRVHSDWLEQFVHLPLLCKDRKRKQRIAKHGRRIREEHERKRGKGNMENE